MRTLTTLAIALVLACGAVAAQATPPRPNAPVRVSRLPTEVARAAAAQASAGSIEVSGTITIEGRIARPQLFFILAPARAPWAGELPSHAFVRRIVGDAQERPF